MAHCDAGWSKSHPPRQLCGLRPRQLEYSAKVRIGPRAASSSPKQTSRTIFCLKRKIGSRRAADLSALCLNNENPLSDVRLRHGLRSVQKGTWPVARRYSDPKMDSVFAKCSNALVPIWPRSLRAYWIFAPVWPVLYIVIVWIGRQPQEAGKMSLAVKLAWTQLELNVH